MPISNLANGKVIAYPREIERQLRLLIWAAKCHVHQQAIFPMRLGALPHSVDEVQAAIDALDTGALKLAPCSDEGIKSTSAGRDINRIRGARG
jgi:hypothetical protein